MYKTLFQTLQQLANPEKAKTLQRFFKTGRGEYGESDKFLGITIPDIRKVIKNYERNLNLNDIETLLHSERHEVRMCALLMLVERVRPSSWRRLRPVWTAGGRRGSSWDTWPHISEPPALSGDPLQKGVVDLYLRNTSYINNRDLIDLTAPEIVGRYYFDKDRSKLYELASSPSLRERRIAILATFYFIKQGQHQDTFKLAELLLHDNHDLIQKAVWRMLREVGKRIDTSLLLSFLDLHATQMPRTMLRYAIERLPEPLRKSYLQKKSV